jgi:hypothetical protein
MPFDDGSLSSERLAELMSYPLAADSNLRGLQQKREEVNGIPWQ